MEKNKLRSKLVSIRDKRPVSFWEEQALAENLFENFLFPKGATVGGYWPIRNEADPVHLLSKLFNMGVTICLPEIKAYSKVLNFRKWCPYHPLQPGKFGTFQPWADQPILTPNIVFVPIVGFDSKGRRLGYGGGYYDNTIYNLNK